MRSFKSKLADAIARNDSLLCVGLDSDSERLPKHFADEPEPMFAFNKAIIDATAEYVCSFKPNSAFYEAEGPSGIEQLYETCRYISDKYPDIPIIIDAKRADIGSTNAGYAKFVFEYLGADALTVHPYLGQEAVQTFLDYKDKGIIVLCRTSNPGAKELQDLDTGDEQLYKVVARNVAEKWNKNGNCLLVVGATYPEELAEVRSIVGDEMDFLVPGIGAQGGDLEATLKAGLNSGKNGLIISSSRDIIFAGSGEDFAEAAAAKAKAVRDEINKYRQ